MDELRFDHFGLDQGPALVHLDSGDVRHEFMTWLGPGILGPKLEGFISSQNAEVLESSDDHLRILLGTESRSLWSRSKGEIPVELTLTINRQTPCVRNMTHVIADMHPHARKTKAEALETRCSKIARDLRYCFFGQDLQVVTAQIPKPGVRPAFSSEPVR